MHFIDLKFDIRRGIRFSKTHIDHRFKQLPWRAKKIKFKREQKIKAKTEVEKLFHN